MWDIVGPYFEKYPARARVANILISYGLSVNKSGDIYCGKVKVSKSAIARALKLDKRTVDETIKMIISEPFLRKIFSNLQPICNLKFVASTMNGWDVIEISVEDTHKPGILAPIAALIAKEGVSIRQVVIGYREGSWEEIVYLITENPIPEKIFRKIKDIEGVKEVRHLIFNA